jgi:dipeptidyl aminopeptidase/acylaminoacyl peptidase
MTYLALTKTKRLSAVIVDAGVADAIDWIEQRPDIEEVFSERVPGYSSNREQALAERSPTRFVDRFPADVPILLLHRRGHKLDFVLARDVRALRTSCEGGSLAIPLA